MKYLIYYFFISCILTKCQGFDFDNTRNSEINGSFENVDLSHLPIRWKIGSIGNKNYFYSIDSTEAKDGHNSLFIKSIGEVTGSFGVVTYVIPQTYKGHQIQLKGYIKTKNVTNGFAGLWLRIDGKNNPVAFDNMQDQHLTGTNDWKEYVINLPYDDTKARSIVLGGILVGSGQMWLDDLRLFIDSIPIGKVEKKILKLPNAEIDTVFNHHSGIDTISLNSQLVSNLALTCKVWGFLKYHHPAVAQGNFNMDAELFKILPEVLKSKNNQEFSFAIENWLDHFGVPQQRNYTLSKKGETDQHPSYGGILDCKAFSVNLRKKLNYILENRNSGSNYYVAMETNVGNPNFENELPYSEMLYPDPGFRLLSLFRYWNIIQYFYPYKKTIGVDWDNQLQQFIPLILKSHSATDYDVNILALISSIHDTHAKIWSSLPALEKLRGTRALPFQAKFIEGQLTITGYYFDTLKIKNTLRIGDVINSIDGQKVNDLIKKYLPYTAASNYPTQLRDLPSTYLLRTNKTSLSLEVSKNKKLTTFAVNTIDRSKFNFANDYSYNPNASEYKKTEKNIGYLFAGKYKNDDLPKIKSAFSGTIGLIVDMRCYPSDFMPFTFGSYIKSGYSAFVKFSTGNIDHPGLFTIGEPFGMSGAAEYPGKVVVLVNELTQSQAEYSVMAFQSSPNVIVIGSTTAGADGNVSKITLPGRVETMISGIGIFYPDGTPTQRVGVKINQIVRPTIEGVKQGRDELLEMAEDIIRGKK